MVSPHFRSFEMMNFHKRVQPIQMTRTELGTELVKEVPIDREATSRRVTCWTGPWNIALEDVGGPWFTDTFTTRIGKKLDRFLVHSLDVWIVLWQS